MAVVETEVVEEDMAVVEEDGILDLHKVNGTQVSRVLVMEAIESGDRAN